jgi:hypothetical protein
MFPILPKMMYFGKMDNPLSGYGISLLIIDYKTKGKTRIIRDFDVNHQFNGFLASR